MSPPVDVRLYVSARSARSGRAIETARALQAVLTPLGGRCEIVDVRESPQLAEEDRVIATPVIVRRQPEPRLRVIGDVSDLTQLLDRLELPIPRSASETP